MPGSVGTAIGIGSSVVNGITGMNNASNNAQLAQQAGQQSNQVATNTYNTNSQNFNPYIQTGSSATNALGGLLGLNGNTAAQGQFQNYLNSTNYQFQLGQGEDAVKYLNAPALNSGGTAKALNNYAQGMAGNALQGYESLLGGLGGQGLTAATNQGSLGSQYASQYANNTFGSIGGQIAANNQGQGALQGMTNGIAQGLSSFTGSPSASSFGGGGSGGADPFLGQSYLGGPASSDAGFNAFAGL